MRFAGHLIIIFLLFGGIGYFAYGMIGGYRQAPAPKSSNSVSIPLLAVGDNGSGMVIPLVTEIAPGTGKVLVNIDNPSFILDTQESMRLAVEEAARMTGTNAKNYDITFSLNGNVTVIGGPSAGAAMTVSAMALMLSKQIKQNAAITGTIEDGGSIGQVGGILEKAEAARDYGVDLLLVPVGEAYSREPMENCTHTTGKGWTQKECTIVYNTINVSKEAGIAIEEVGTISDAMRYLLE